MPEENVEIARRALLAAWRDPPDWPALAELYTEDHVMVTATDAVDGGAWRGEEGFRAWLENVADGVAWESTLGEVTALDGDRVLATMPTRMRGRASDMQFGERDLTAVLTFRRGRIARTVVHGSRQEALDAAGVARTDSG